MTTLALAFQLILAAVFAVAGIAKLADLGGSRRALVHFGLPAGVIRPAAVVLPLVELAIAGALLPDASARWGAAAGCALLGVFAAGIVRVLSQGKTADCHCFGQVHSRTVSSTTLVRDLALAALAAFVVWHPAGGGPSQEALIALAVTGGFALQGWFSFLLLRQNGRLLVRLEGLEAATGTSNPRPPELPVGAPAPAFALPGLDGETHTSASLLTRGRPVLLVFSDPGCGPCDALLPAVSLWQSKNANRLTVVLISRGTRHENLARRNEHALTDVLLQETREVANAYQAFATPSAVLLDVDGTVASPLAVGAEAIRALLDRSLNEMASPSGVVHVNGKNASAVSSPEAEPPTGGTAKAPPARAPQKAVLAAAAGTLVAAELPADASAASNTPFVRLLIGDLRRLGKGEKSLQQAVKKRSGPRVATALRSQRIQVEQLQRKVANVPLANARERAAQPWVLDSLGHTARGVGQLEKACRIPFGARKRSRRQARKRHFADSRASLKHARSSALKAGRKLEL